MYKDTIAAISTPLGEGGIGIVRLSGDESADIARKIFDGKLQHRYLSYGHIVDPENGEIIDEVLVAFMKAPHTYTREDITEINCHGGAVPLRKVLGLALRYGARLANPGEFTLRAFLNGRIDLAQAEAVRDIVEAKTEASLKLAVQGLAGRLSTEIKAVRSDLLNILAYLSARIDFPEDDIEGRDIKETLAKASERLRSLMVSADDGMIFRYGVNTAIVGRPNVGKSSLLNRLLGEDRAIVTSIPGTTRDTIEEVVNISGVPFLLVDTAGIKKSKDLLESLGIERSRRAIERADLVLLVLDRSEPLMPEDREILDMLGDKKVIKVVNKIDLSGKLELSEINGEKVRISALSGEGIDALRSRMVESVLPVCVRTGRSSKEIDLNSIAVINLRHKNALERADIGLQNAINAIKSDTPDDFVSIDLTIAVNSLGEITGETVSEQLLETIFSQFCIGK